MEQGLTPTVNKLNRKLVKCINTCKSQASKASRASKKLVENIKEKSKRSSTEQNEFESDNISWGSDFNDSDFDSDHDDAHITSHTHSLSNSHANVNANTMSNKNKESSSGRYDLESRQKNAFASKLDDTAYYEPIFNGCNIQATGFKLISDDREEIQMKRNSNTNDVAINVGVNDHDKPIMGMGIRSSTQSTQSANNQEKLPDNSSHYEVVYRNKDISSEMNDQLNRKINQTQTLKNKNSMHDNLNGSSVSLESNANPSPNQCSRSIPKPPNKPQVPNKPAIIPRKKLSNGAKPPNASIKRPPSDPPPPPLPKSPPPSSPTVISPELESVISNDSLRFAKTSESTNSSSPHDDMYEPPNIIPTLEDGYLFPVQISETSLPPHPNLERKQSFSTISTVSSSVRDFDSLNGSCSPLSLASSSNASSVHSSRHIDGDVYVYDEDDSILGACYGDGAIHSNATHVISDNENHYEGAYEVVQDNGHDSNSTTEKDVQLDKVLSAVGRPLLPKQKEPTHNLIGNKSKLPGIANWSRKIMLKDKGSGELNNCVKDGLRETKSVLPTQITKELPQQTKLVRSASNNIITNTFNQSKTPSNIPLSTQFSARPLPPLPRPTVGSKAITTQVPLLSNANNNSVNSTVQSKNASHDMRHCSWYQDIEREDAEELVKSQQDNGVYLVRDSKRGGIHNPYTLTIYNDGRVFHLNIRKRADGTFALGKEKAKEKAFNTVEELISHHHNESILLTSKGASAGKTKLRYSPNTQY